MNTYHLGNLRIEVFRLFLEEHHLKRVDSGNSGHEKWMGDHMTRPVIFQTHIDPIPEFIVRNNLRNMGLTSQDLRQWLKEKDIK